MRAAAIDMRDVAEFDTYGAWLLERLTREWTARGQEMSVRSLPERYRGLLEGGAARQSPGRVRQAQGKPAACRARDARHEPLPTWGTT